jgi:sugar lactone lactonase YvrE
MFPIETVIEIHNDLGEGPLWRPQQKCLYWVDILRGQFFTYYPVTGCFEQKETGGILPSIAFRKKGGFVFCTQHGFTLADPSGRELEILADPEAGKPGARFNDGAVDPLGRYWAGTMTDQGATSSLYCLDAQHTVRRMETGLTISNGMGWSPEAKTMYLTDTKCKLIFAYDFDTQNGEITHQRVFVDTSCFPGFPDGMSVDSLGYVWSVQNMGGILNRYAPSGKLDVTIPLPTSAATSCTFGGEDLSDLYITSSVRLATQAEKDAPSQAGNLFRMHCEVTGMPVSFYAG